jgi:hypothetical protein
VSEVPPTADGFGLFDFGGTTDRGAIITPCGSAALILADGSWAHFACISYDLNPSTGTCGDLTQFTRYVSRCGAKPCIINWGRAVRYFMAPYASDSGWNAGCFTANRDCTGAGETFTAGVRGSTCDPNGICWWLAADATVQAANGIYAYACP